VVGEGRREGDIWAALSSPSVSTLALTNPEGGRVDISTGCAEVCCGRAVVDMVYTPGVLAGHDSCQARDPLVEVTL
jgi:hypothetical protein